VRRKRRKKGERDGGEGKGNRAGRRHRYMEHRKKAAVANKLIYAFVW
jgi:hypothetical protein